MGYIEEDIMDYLQIAMDIWKLLNTQAPILSLFVSIITLLFAKQAANNTKIIISGKREQIKQINIGKSNKNNIS